MFVCTVLTTLFDQMDFFVLFLCVCMFLVNDPVVLPAFAGKHGISLVKLAQGKVIPVVV